MLERLKTLAEVFAIDVCAFAILSNHYHVVVHVDRKRAEEWTIDEVISRWSAVFGTPELIKRLQAGFVTEPEKQAAYELIEIWRTRLYEIGPGDVLPATHFRPRLQK